MQERALRCPLQKIQHFLHIAVVLQLAGVRQAEGCAGRISLCCLGEVGNAGVRQLHPDNGGWVKCIQSICVEHCGKSVGEMTV